MKIHISDLLNARVVWEQLGAGKSVREVCDPLPDEFHPWVRKVAYDLIEQATAILDTARDEHERIVAALPAGWSRRDYAGHAVLSLHRAWLFMLLDGKDPASKIWRTLRPSGDDRPVNHGEDVA